MKNIQSEQIRMTIESNENTEKINSIPKISVRYAKRIMEGGIVQISDVKELKQEVILHHVIRILYKTSLGIVQSKAFIETLCSIKFIPNFTTEEWCFIINIAVQHSDCDYLITRILLYFLRPLSYSTIQEKEPIDKLFDMLVFLTKKCAIKITLWNGCLVYVWKYFIQTHTEDSLVELIQTNPDFATDLLEVLKSPIQIYTPTKDEALQDETVCIYLKSFYAAYIQGYTFCFDMFYLLCEVYPKILMNLNRYWTFLIAEDGMMISFSECHEKIRNMNTKLIKSSNKRVIRYISSPSKRVRLF
jgi:hypothetical protein